MTIPPTPPTPVTLAAASRSHRRRRTLPAAWLCLLAPLFAVATAAEDPAAAPAQAPTPPTPTPPAAEEPPVAPPIAAENPPANPDQAHAALYVEQTYTYASIDGGGQRSRDVLQKMYILPDRIAIHDSSESVIVDLKKRTVTNIHHDKKSHTSESFDSIRKRIRERIDVQRKNLDGMVPGPQRNQVYQTIKGFLDDEVTYTSTVKEMVEKNSSGAFLDLVTIDAARTHDGKTTHETVLTAKLSRELVLPFKDFNYAEALFYLELASEKMTREFTGPRAKLVPLELKLQLPTGGSVESKVVKFEYVAGFEDSFFTPPADYRNLDTAADPAVPKPPKINLEDLEE